MQRDGRVIAIALTRVIARVIAIATTDKSVLALYSALLGHSEYGGDAAEARFAWQRPRSSTELCSDEEIGSLYSASDYGLCLPPPSLSTDEQIGALYPASEYGLGIHAEERP
jgi:hypothetical protein